MRERSGFDPKRLFVDATGSPKVGPEQNSRFGAIDLEQQTFVTPGLAVARDYPNGRSLGAKFKIFGVLGRYDRPRAAFYRRVPGTGDGSSWTPEKSQVESCEHQNNANIHRQPFPESVSEEHEIYTDYDGCHRHHVKHDSYLSAHFSALVQS
jgi:hypothetical protein